MNIIQENSPANGDCNTNNDNYNKPYNNIVRFVMGKLTKAKKEKSFKTYFIA